MEKALSENGFVVENTSGLMENRIEALKSLATLLLREVESLKPAAYTADSQIPIDKINLSDEVQRYEEALIREALVRSRGQQRRAAQFLGTKISTLNAKIKRYGIDSYGFLGK